MFVSNLQFVLCMIKYKFFLGMFDWMFVFPSSSFATDCAVQPVTTSDQLHRQQQCQHRYK